MLGVIYDDAGNADQAQKHYQKSIRYREEAKDVYRAAQARHNVAIALAKQRRLADAKDYALAGLRGFQSFGDRAKDDVMKTTPTDRGYRSESKGNRGGGIASQPEAT
jgi:tetratricopeptide (TPR) repeat protein